MGKYDDLRAHSKASRKVQEDIDSYRKALGLDAAPKKLDDLGGKYADLRDPLKYKRKTTSQLMEQFGGTAGNPGVQKVLSLQQDAIMPPVNLQGPAKPASTQPPVFNPAGLVKPQQFGHSPAPVASKMLAPSVVMPAGGGPSNAYNIEPRTQYDINKEGIDNSKIRIPFTDRYVDTPDFLKAPAYGMNWLTRGNPVGQAISNAFAGHSGVVQRDSTGNKTVDKVTDVINDFVTPLLTPTGAPVGMGPNMGTYQAAEQALSRRAGQAAIRRTADAISRTVPRINPARANEIARAGLSETIAGPLQGVAGGLANQQDSNEEILSNALYGLGFGVVGGFGGAALGQLLRRSGIPEAEINEIAGDVLALPEGRGTARQAAAAGRGINAAGTDPIANPFTFELPEASAGTRAAASNAAGGRAGLREIDQAIHELDTRYNQAVIDEYKLLKQQRDNRSGVQQGQLQRDAAGDVVGRTGRISNNPRWYQEFYAANNRVPSNKDLFELARQRVDNGFADEAGQVPSWRAQNNYDEQMSGYQQARSTLAQNLREVDPALQVTDTPLVSRELKDLRRTGTVRRPNRTAPVEESTISQQPPDAPSVRPGTEVTAREMEINRRAEAGGSLPQEDIDYLLERSAARQAANQQPAPQSTPGPLPFGEPILRPGQFDEKSGLGISAFSRVGPYDSLRTDTRSQMVSRQHRENPGATARADKLYTALVDDLHPLNRQDQILDEVMGEKIPANERIHDLGLASRGADVISKRIITEGMVDSRGQLIEGSKSLKSILEPLRPLMRRNKYIYVDFEDYLLNKHAVTRIDRGEKVFRDDLNWTKEYGQQKAREYEQMFPEFAKMANDLYAFQKQMVQSWLVDTGMISQDVANAWFKENPYYVPNKRYFSELEKTGRGFGGKKRGYGNQSVPVKSYQKGGSQRPVIPPIEAIIENVDAYVKSAKRNQVMQQYIRNIEQAPDDFAPWAEVVKQPEKPENIAKIALEDGGIEEIMFRFSADFDKAMQRTQLDKDNVVRALVDGEPVHVKIKDKQLLSALTALGPEQSGKVLQLVGRLTNNMKLLTTGNNPIFTLTRNIFRDIPQAYIASKTTDNPLAFVADLVTAAVDIGRNRGAYRQFLDVGGGHASAIAADRNLLAQSKRAVLPQPPARRALLGAKDKYENFLNAVEAAPRLAEFKRSLKNDGDLIAALQAAQDVTVNFKRRGALSGEVDKIFPYLNAALQGMDKTVRTYRDNPVKALVKSALAVTLPTLALYAINRDDPAYKKLNNRTKDAFLLIPRGDGTFIKIAKPQEQGTIFSDIPERLVRMLADNDPAAWRDFADRIRTTMLPPGIAGLTSERGAVAGALGDTILGPFVDVAANESWSGAPVVPGYLDNLSPGLQADAKTTWPARKLGELTLGTPFEVSPKNVDYLARQYTGFLGQIGQPLLSSGGDLGYTLGQTMTADPVFSNDISNEFYHYKDKLDQANNDKELRELPEWYNDGLRKRMAKISKSMSKIRAQMRDVQDNDDLSNKQKRDELRKLQESINAMAEMGNGLARDKVPY